MTQPIASRPHIGHKEYGVPETTDGMLDWQFAVERLQKAKNYWVSTVSPDGSPHARPVWGVFVENTLYFGGGPLTRWSKNLAHNPQVVVHLESGDEVVILEGTVERITEDTHPMFQKVDDAYLEKYNMRHGVPFWVLKPKRAFAWHKFPTDTTRWTFE